MNYGSKIFIKYLLAILSYLQYFNITEQIRYLHVVKHDIVI